MIYIFYHDCSLDIFEQTISTNEPIEKLVKRELLIFRKYQLDVKDIKCLFQWWQKHETMFFYSCIFSSIDFRDY
jgi:hypothetical protein